MNAASIHNLYLCELQEMHHAERQLIRALPKVAEGVSTPRLAEAIKANHYETRRRAERLERMFRRLSATPGDQRCAAMRGLIEEAREILNAAGDDAVRDVGIIIAAQKIAHYEIAGYGCLCALARLLGRTDDVRELEASLAEEKLADATLTDVANKHVNVAAAQ